MKAKSRQSGLTLTEMVVVIATIALLVGLGMPAGRAFLNSFETESGARSMISAALASARAVAAKEQRYAGVRFQKAYQPAGLLKARQYMIFIIQDPEIGAYFFRAVEGLKPIKLPDSVGVMDLRYKSDLFAPPGDGIIDDDSEISNLNVFRDTTTFSIVFSPSGKMVIHKILVINREGKKYSDNSEDDVFNSESKAKDEIAMFVQDKYFSINGLEEEQSKNSFIVYDRKIFEGTDENRRYSDYLEGLEVIYINPYTGTIINR